MTLLARLTNRTMETIRTQFYTVKTHFGGECRVENWRRLTTCAETSSVCTTLNRRRAPQKLRPLRFSMCASFRAWPSRQWPMRPCLLVQSRKSLARRSNSSRISMSLGRRERGRTRPSRPKPVGSNEKKRCANGMAADMARQGPPLSRRLATAGVAATAIIGVTLKPTPTSVKQPVAFVPHGGGPWPFVDVGFGAKSDEAHLKRYLESVSALPSSWGAA
jgi:hypothetical protein